MRTLILHNTLEPNAGADALDVLEQASTVASALESAGWECDQLACGLDLGTLRSRLQAEPPDLVFNLVESLGGEDRLIHFVPALLEALGLPFTGASAEAAFASAGKLSTKAILARAGLPVPPTIAIHPRSIESPDGTCTSTDTDGPFLIKSTWIHGSKGLESDALVANRRELREALARLAGRMGGECLAEPYIQGREFNLAIIGTAAGPLLLPPAEIRFAGFADAECIVGYRAKWEPGSVEYDNTVRVLDFPPSDAQLLKHLGQLAVASWRALRMTGYARVDFRVSTAGVPYILEVNANPCLSPDAGFAAAAEHSGRGLVGAILEIADDALRRARVKGALHRDPTTLAISAETSRAS